MQMKITVYYEDNRDRTTIEVPDEDCEIWVENDYRQRLAVAEDKASVTRRTPQQIMDEECDKPTYNNEHRETRRHVSFDALDPMGDTLIGEDGVDLGLGPDGFEYLERAIEKLRPRQRELLRKVFWEDIRQVEIARAEGVEEHVISKRMARIYAKLKEIIADEKNFSEKR